MEHITVTRSSPPGREVGLLSESKKGLPKRMQCRRAPDKKRTVDTSRQGIRRAKKKRQKKSALGTLHIWDRDRFGDRSFDGVVYVRLSCTPNHHRFSLVKPQSARRRCSNDAFARIEPLVQATGGHCGLRHWWRNPQRLPWV